MKRLVCDMCEGTDFVKENGVFVCQGCGCKYSVEEARRMMSEAPAAPAVQPGVEVQVSNAAQLENLLNLAQSSYDSKNYAQAEEFCNKVIAIDAQNFEAWKLKGMAVNYQITASNPRLLEVYNCLMTAYRVLDDKGKAQKRAQIMTQLRECFEGEIEFWLKQIEVGRPTKDAVLRAYNSYIDCWNKMQSACEDMGLGLLKSMYLSMIDNHFISCALTRAVSTWKSTVAYNYYREKYSGGRWTTESYRPSDEIFSTFVSEGSNLIKLMLYCEKAFNDQTRPEARKNVYSNMIFIHKELIGAQSWKRMVKTTTNGYGAVISRREYWADSKNLTQEAINLRRKDIAEYEQKLREIDNQIAAKAKEEARRKIEEYWRAHAEEKRALDAEQAQLEARLDLLNKNLEAIPERAERDRLQERIRMLSGERDALGVFKAREKKALQDQIDALNAELRIVNDRYSTLSADISSGISSAKRRLAEIRNELNKAR